MTTPAFNYDEVSDTLYVSFGLGEGATGVELNEHILLRINKAERRAVGLTLFDYQLLTKPTELGPRSFPLDGLAELSPELRTIVLEILASEPVRGILSVSVYTPAPDQNIPITSLRPISPLAA
jgi:uncharacterized protein YuzE